MKLGHKLQAEGTNISSDRLFSCDCWGWILCVTTEQKKKKVHMQINIRVWKNEKLMLSVSFSSETRGCRSQLNSVQQPEQPVNSSLHYLQFPLWGQYQIFRAIRRWLCGFINYRSHREHLLIMIPAEKLLVQCDTEAVKQPLTVRNRFWSGEKGQQVCETHTAFTPRDHFCLNLIRLKMPGGFTICSTARKENPVEAGALSVSYKCTFS